jgi:hypothetical protein
MSENTEVSVQSPAALRVPEATWALFAVIVAGVVGTVYRFGYPALISIALFATFAAISMLVGLTALDVFPKAPRKSR